MAGLHFKKVDFGVLRKYLGLEKTDEGEWTRQDNGISVKPLISEKESVRRNLTYVGLIFEKETDAHFYKSQTDVICFKNDGIIEFYDGYEVNEKDPSRAVTDKGKFRYPFPAEYAVEIPPPVVRKLAPKPGEKNLEIELIVRPRFDSEDEVHVYD